MFKHVGTTKRGIWEEADATVVQFDVHDWSGGMRDVFMVCPIMRRFLAAVPMGRGTALRWLYGPIGGSRAQFQQLLRPSFIVSTIGSHQPFVVVANIVPTDDKLSAPRLWHVARMTTP